MLVWWCFLFCNLSSLTTKSKEARLSFVLEPMYQFKGTAFRELQGSHWFSSIKMSIHNIYPSSSIIPLESGQISPTKTTQLQVFVPFIQLQFWAVPAPPPCRVHVAQQPCRGYQGHKRRLLRLLFWNHIFWTKILNHQFISGNLFDQNNVGFCLESGQIIVHDTRRRRHGP